MQTETYRILFEEMLEGVAICEIIRDRKGRPIDYRFRALNPAFAQMMEIDPRETIGRLASETSLPFIEEFSQALERTVRFELGIPGINRQFRVIAFSLADELALIFHDQSELRFRNAILEAPSPIMIHAEDGEILQINKAWSELTGYAPEELPTIGAWTSKAFGRRKGSTRKRIERLYELKESSREGEFAIRTKHGTVRRWELRSAPLGKSWDGRRMVISMANDVTDRNRVEEQLKRLNEDLESHISARTAQLVAINKRLEQEILDRRQAEQELQRVSRALRVLAETNHVISSLDDRSALLSEVCRILVEVGGYRLAWIGETLHDERERIRPLAVEGYPPEDLPNFAPSRQTALPKREHAGCIAIPLSIGNNDGTLTIFSSEAHAFNEEEVELLKQLAKNLSFGLGALEERQERERLHAEKIRVLEQGETFKDEFLSVMSHELRTPLNVITGFGSLLLDEAAGPLDPQQREFLDKMLDNADQMIAVVEGLLDYAGIRAGRLTIFPSKQDYALLVTDALHTVEGTAREKKIQLRQEIRVPQAVSFDSQRLLQTLKHLLSNAVKFTPEGGVVKVKAFIEGQALVTETLDTGIGISPEDLPRLFQPFHQLDMSLTRENGGTGIGLSICKAIVEAHGGSICAASQGPGQGSIFRFVLPLL